MTEMGDAYWASALLRSYNEHKDITNVSNDSAIDGKYKAPKLVDILLHKSPYRIPTPPLFENLQGIRKAISVDFCQESSNLQRSRHASAPVVLTSAGKYVRPLLSEEELRVAASLSKPLHELAKFVNDRSSAMAQKTFPERVKEAIPDIFDPVPPTRQPRPKFGLFREKSQRLENKSDSRSNYDHALVKSPSVPYFPEDWLPEDFLNELDLIRPIVPVDSGLYLSGMVDFDI